MTVQNINKNPKNKQTKMEPIVRTITVYDQNTQEKTVIENVSVNTFGELKTLLREKGINLDGMDVREGISRVDLKSDSAVLPHDTPYRDGTTNDLMILLTKTNKKVASGLMGRSEAVKFIRDNNLQEAVKESFDGKNYTNLSTEALVDFVEKYMGKKPKASNKNLEGALKCLVGILYDSAYLDEEERDLILGKLDAPSCEDDDKGFSQEEIYDAISQL